MRIKLQNALQPAEHRAHSIIVFDDKDNPLFAAMHLADGIVYSSLGERDFPVVLEMLGIDKPPTIIEIPPPPK